MNTFEELKTNNAPKAIGPYSQGIVSEKTVFVSGQLGINPSSGQLENKDIRIQTERVIENLRAILKEANLDLHDVVRCDVFLKDMNDFQVMNEVYASKFTADPKPVRQAVQVAKLPLDAMVEISCIALKRDLA